MTRDTDATQLPVHDEEAVRRNDRAHVFHSWSAQALIDPLPIAGAEGSYFWDYSGKRYLDFSSQLVNVNIGYQHPAVVAAIKEQVDRMATLVAAMATYSLASLLCAAATGIGALIALRFIQGLAGAGGIVIARAVVRDLHSGAAAVRLFSSLMLVTGLAPILAPVVGGQLLALTSWEGIFLALAFGLLVHLATLLVTSIGGAVVLIFGHRAPEPADDDDDDAVDAEASDAGARADTNVPYRDRTNHNRRTIPTRDEGG